MWGHMDTEQISSLCGQSQQRWPVGESDMGNELEYWKSHRLGFTVVAEWLKMPRPMTRAVLRLNCCDSAFLVAVSTMSIICSVTLFWIIAPWFSEEVWRDSVHLGWRDRILLLECCDLMIFALDSKLYFKLEQLNERKTKDGLKWKETKSSIFWLMPFLFLLPFFLKEELHTCWLPSSTPTNSFPSYSFSYTGTSLCIYHQVGMVTTALHLFSASSRPGMWGWDPPEPPSPLEGQKA